MPLTKLTLLATLIATTLGVCPMQMTMMPMNNMAMREEMADQNMPCSECYSDNESYALKDAGSLGTDPILMSVIIPEDSIEYSLNIASTKQVSINVTGPLANAPPLVGTVILRT
ncbi:MAG: hypothetical protein QF741_02550 [Candidatus Peribacteraceae bacterium]|nr:hypothetical protein [Candidatus Peribacteraceae bacterium]MDP7454837.1 hypothetical protein [Candidatus Peribacteraceae bacterium]MDP7646067.1 hypothetical protein [Candidatus Peribacteraceae bacterium]